MGSLIELAIAATYETRVGIQALRLLQSGQPTWLSGNDVNVQYIDERPCYCRFKFQNVQSIEDARVTNSTMYFPIWIRTHNTKIFPNNYICIYCNIYIIIIHNSYPATQQQKNSTLFQVFFFYDIFQYSGI